MEMRRLLIASAACVLLAACVYSQSTIPWYEDLPAVAMDYKVHVDPGKEDCYFQYVNTGATFFVSFQVSFKLNTHLPLIGNLEITKTGCD